MWTGGNHSGCIRRNFLTAVRWRGYVRGSRRTELETQMMTPDDFELWQRHQHDGEEVYDPTTGEICDAEEYLQAMGFQPVRVHTRDLSPDVIPAITTWAMGGIVKGGAYITFNCNFFLDLIIGYSFARAKNNLTGAPTGSVTPLHSSVSGAIFGAGIGYRF